MLRGRSVLTVLTVAVVAAVQPASAGGQSVRVAVPQENLRKEPRVTANNKLATVFEGTPLSVAGSRGRWSQVSLEGWIWSRSVAATERDGFDLVVTRAGGENLRQAPGGRARRVAVLLRGMLLDRLEDRGSWTKVRRTAWMWTESLAESQERTQSEEESARQPVPDETADSAATPPSRLLPDRLVVAGSPVRLLVSPEGDTVAAVRPGTDLAVLARRGEWARVRVEGWVWIPATLPGDSVDASGELSAADLRANPDQYVGRRVRWRVQFISLEQAEPVRTDFYEGEPFILARAADRPEGFVYIAVPPELVAEVAELRSLQMIDVLARVRTGRSALMGVPILDLIAVE